MTANSLCPDPSRQLHDARRTILRKLVRHFDSTGGFGFAIGDYPHEPRINRVMAKGTPRAGHICLRAANQSSSPHQSENNIVNENFIANSW